MNSHRHEITLKRVVVLLPAGFEPQVRYDIPYGETDERTLDVYLPARATLSPAVLFVTGYPDAGMRRVVGCNAKDMDSYVSWAQLMTASGMAAITYSGDDPAGDAQAVVAFLRQHGGSLGIDGSRLGVWSCSGNVPNALALLMDTRPRFCCAAFCYGYALDDDGGIAVAEASRRFGFTNTAAGRRIDELPEDLPMLLVRAGRDEMPGLNGSIERFVSRALALNLPVTAINHPTGPHAFDIADDTESSRAVVREILRFLGAHLGMQG